MIHLFRKRNETLTDELVEEANIREKAEEAKTNVEKELMTLYEQVEMARAAAVTEFKALQDFIEASNIYYGDGLRIT